MQVYEEFVQMMAKWQKRSGPGTGTKKTQEMAQLIVYAAKVLYFQSEEMVLQPEEQINSGFTSHTGEGFQ